MGEYLVGTYNFFGYEKGGHKVRDFPMHKAREKESNHEQASGPSSDAPNKNHYYALLSKGYHEDAPDVVTGIFLNCSPLMSMV